MKIRFDQAAPYEVEETDVPFARAEGEELHARVYRPRGQADIALAALVDVHGGAWSRGDRLTGAFHGRALAASGLLVFSLDFRQGSEAKHPAASADIAAGVRYVRANAQRLGVDPQRIGIVGSSSGGQLALLAGVKPGAPEHAGTPIVRADSSLDAGPGDESVAFVLALYPVADPLARFRYVIGRQDDGSGFDAQRLIVAHLVAPAVVAGAAPEGRSEAPVGQITWAVHTTLVPTYFDPAETTIITSFMVLYALHDGLVKPMPGAARGEPGRIVVRIARRARLRLRSAPGREIPQR